MRLRLKAVNDELAKRGYTSRQAKGGDYFYFQFGEAEDRLDRTVNVPTVNSLSLAEWMAEFDRLKRVQRRDHGRAKDRDAGAEGETNPRLNGEDS